MRISVILVLGIFLYVILFIFFGFSMIISFGLLSLFVFFVCLFFVFDWEVIGGDVFILVGGLVVISWFDVEMGMFLIKALVWLLVWIDIG